ncbi:MAG TPA: aminotransferase class IV [Pyrinomonadaceae bacterium]|nr:aminotransferase class IV [Pyrinomonadaceae bacterium]
MHTWIHINGRIIRAENAYTSAVSTAAFYGKGVFSTIAITDGKPLLWSKHWRRLALDAAKVGIDLTGHSEETTRKALEELIERNAAKAGRARVTFMDEMPGPIWTTDAERQTLLSIITADRRIVPDHFRLTVSPFALNSMSPLAGVKSCNYLENLLALDDATRRGFDEAVRPNEHGQVTGGCMSNVFWRLDGRLYTPSLATGCLAGTTREFVIESTECAEVEAAIEELRAADTIYLTSTGIGIAAVAQIDSRSLAPADHPILSLWPPA